MTPAARQQARVAAGTESSTKHPEMGPNGTLFTIKGGQPTQGSCNYANGLTHRVDEAATDGGVLTFDVRLAVGLRSMGIYNEAKQ